MDDLASTLTWLFAALVVADWIIFFTYPQGFPVWDFLYGPAYVLLCFALALLSALDGEWGPAIFMAFFSAYGAYRWWNNDRHRRRRKKLLEKGMGRVVDLGGRLKVVPAKS